MSRPAVEFRAPGAADIDALAANMRPLDVAECQAAGVTDLRECIADGVQHSDLCWAVLIDGELAAIFGTRPLGSLLNPTAAVWLLGTPVLTANRRAFARHTPRYIRQMLQAHPHLVNFVHAENTPAVRFLRHHGFTIHEPVAVSTGAMFHPFEMRDV
jgi:hypothetical protein